MLCFTKSSRRACIWPLNSCMKYKNSNFSGCKQGIPVNRRLIQWITEQHSFHLCFKWSQPTSSEKADRWDPPSSLPLSQSHLRASRLAITTLDRQQPPFPLIQRDRWVAEPPVECQLATATKSISEACGAAGGWHVVMTTGKLEIGVIGVQAQDNRFLWRSLH